MKISQGKSKRKEWFTINKKVLIISSSPRRGGNSETLAAAFAKGAQAADHQVETVYLREKQIGYCKGCFPRCTLAGTVFAGGVNGVGEIAGHIALEQAYQAGKEV